MNKENIEKNKIIDIILIIINNHYTSLKGSPYFYLPTDLRNSAKGLICLQNKNKEFLKIFCRIIHVLPHVTCLCTLNGSRTPRGEYFYFVKEQTSLTTDCETFIEKMSVFDI